MKDTQLPTSSAPRRRAGVSVADAGRDKPLAPASPCVVGIGASAGGYEAIRKFFQAMPVTEATNGVRIEATS